MADENPCPWCDEQINWLDPDVDLLCHHWLFSNVDAYLFDKFYH